MKTRGTIVNLMHRHACNLIAGACGWMAVAGTAMGQESNAPTPPLPPSLNNKFDDAPVIMMYLGGALLFAAVIAAGVIPAKRGHQD
jgi:hypothetical protein